MKLQFRYRTLLLLVILASLGLWATIEIFRAHGPGGNGIIAHLKLIDGSEYLLEQEWNQPTEPYTVSFYFRKKGGAWGWCYVAHQDTRWHHAELRLNKERNSIELLRAGNLQGELLLENDTFTPKLGRDGWVVDAPQEWRAPKQLPKE